MNWNGTVTLPLSVSYVYHPAHNGSKGRFRVPLEPDDPAEVSIESVTINGRELPALSEQALQMISEACMKDAEADPLDY